MSPLIRKARYRTEINWIDWLLMATVISLPGLVCYSFFAPIF